MAFRTVELNGPAEVHVKNGQLLVSKEGETISVPLEDIVTIVVQGANLRISTMAEMNIARSGITLMIIDEKYRPACVLTPIESNVRQALIIRDLCAEALVELLPEVLRPAKNGV